jgi:hypothetical protein
MGHHVHLEQFPSKPLAVVKRHANSRQQVGAIIQKACGDVWSVIKSQRVAGAGRHVTVYLDQNFNLEIGVELESPFGGFGEVIGSSLPACSVVTTTHLGPYPQLADAHQAIQQWCAAKQLELAGPCWEIYGHWLDEWNRDPSKIRTDIYYPLKGADKN